MSESSSLDEVFLASEEFKAWYATTLAPRVKNFKAITRDVAEWGALRGWMGARGLDLDAALAEETARQRAATKSR